MKKRVYLCGGIDHLNQDAIHGWRERAKALLGIDCVAVDPTRKMLAGESSEAVKARIPDAEIVRLDLEDIRSCQVLLANVNRPSWGTAMEIALAREWGVTTVLFVTELDATIYSPFLQVFGDHKFASLEAAVAKVNTL